MFPHDCKLCDLCASVVKFMLVDLVQTAARDGVRLDGTYQSPPGDRASALAIDAFCLVHGTGSNFYGSTLFDALAERLLELGCGVLRINTRGHDGLSTATTARGGLRQGAAFEIVADCRHDLAGWMEWLTRRAGPRLGLIGHSLGAVKCLYAVAQEPALRPACLVAISPPRLSYEAFCSGSTRDEFLGAFQRASEHVEHGNSTTLMEVKVPLPMTISAAGYLEKYGPDERYNFLKFAGGVGCPTLFTFGSVEVESIAAFRGLPEAVAELKKRYSNLDVATIAGADHFYSATRREVVETVGQWLLRQSLSSGARPERGVQ